MDTSTNTALDPAHPLGSTANETPKDTATTSQASNRAADAAEDLELVRRVRDFHDQEAYATLVEKYKDPVYNVAYRMLGNGTEAEDIAQEAFVRAYTQIGTYKEQHRFSTWLLSITSHLAIDQLRRRRFLALPLDNVPFLEWIADMGPSPETSALRVEASDEMQVVLNQLPEKYRVPLILRYWYDYSYEEIANTLDLTPPLVKARLHRARELVERIMQEDRSRYLAANPDLASEVEHDAKSAPQPNKATRKSKVRLAVE